MIASLGDEQFVPQNTANSAGYGALMFGYLINTDGDGNLVPGIAESWQVSDDGLVWTFEIREGVTFQNGEPVTAEDVAFSLNHTFSKEGAETTLVNTVAVVAGLTESIEVTGPNTVQVTHTQPLPDFAGLMSQLAPNLTGAIFPQAYFEEVGPEGFAEEPISAGPYRMVEHRSAQRLTFERFDDYYLPDQLPHFETIELLMVPELSTRVQALRSGEADLIAAESTVADQIESVGHQVILGPEGQYLWFMLPGCWDEKLPCHDPKVRLALDLALDKETIMGSTYGDAWDPRGWMQASPSAVGYAPGLDPRPFDPDRAKALLAEAGYPDGKDFPVLEIAYPTGDQVPLIPEVALQVASMWNEVLGIETDVRTGDAEAVNSQWRSRELDGSAFIRGNTGRWDGTSLDRTMYSAEAGDTRLSEDPKLDALVKAAARVTDATERDAAYVELHRTLRDSNETISMGSLSVVWGASDKLDGWQPIPLMAGVQGLWTVDR